SCATGRVFRIPFLCPVYFFPPSWPGKSAKRVFAQETRPSTSLLATNKQVVDARVKPGHDARRVRARLAEYASSVRLPASSAIPMLPPSKTNKPQEMPAPLDPVVEKIIPLLPLRDPAVMTPQSAREALRALAASRAAIPPPQVASAEDIKVKGAAGFLAARVYRVNGGKAPTVLFFHGGGWVAGDLETHDRQARYLAIETGAVVVSVDYRRPPEVRFPGAFEDAFAALRDVVARIAEF